MPKHEKSLYKKTYARIMEITNDSLLSDDICEMLKTSRKNQYNDDFQKFIYDRLMFVYINASERPQNLAQNLLDEWEQYKIRFGKGVKELKLKFRYGEIEGEKRWAQYCEKQRVTNTFEYKKEKYNWTREQFDEYNNSRSVTKENIIRRHGYDKGTNMWNSYCQRQSYAGCSKEYFIEKLGLEQGTEKFYEINKTKEITLANFIRKYGENQGKIKFNEYLKKKSEATEMYSKTSQKFFNELLKRIPIKYHSMIFFGSKNHEYFFNNSNMKNVCFVDFYDMNTHKAIEFMGDYFHCNPLKYKGTFVNTTVKMTASEIWQKDIIRENMLKKEFNLSILNIWESDARKKEQETIEKCLKFLNYECCI